MLQWHEPSGKNQCKISRSDISTVVINQCCRSDMNPLVVVCSDLNPLVVNIVTVI